MRRDIPGNPSNEYIFNAFGQHASVWDAIHGWASRVQAYWGSMPVELNNGGAAHYQQQDWLGTERMVTGYIGSVEGTYTSLPFGDGFQVTGSDPDQYHFAGLDYEYKVGTSGGALARFRMYYNTTGRWMSPDLYSGSYDFMNPQSFDRYSYVTNNPLSVTDPEGLFENSNGGDGGGGAGCDLTCQIITLGIDDLINWLEGRGGPKFTGSLKPRPNGQPWDEYHIHWWNGANLAGALGIPDAGCEFGACGDIGNALEPGAAGVSAATFCSKHPTVCAWANYLATHPVFFSFNEGFAVQATVQWSTKTFCGNVGLGASVPYPTRIVTFGLYNAGQMEKWKSVLSGFGYSFGANLGPGYTASINKSGTIGGPTVSGPGISGSYTYGECWTLP